MSSFDEYVRARGSGLLRFAYLMCQDAHLAEDLTREALARCHRAWRRVSAAGDPDAYVRKAVLRQFLSWRRRKSAMEKITGDMTVHASTGRRKRRPRGADRPLDAPVRAAAQAAGRPGPPAGRYATDDELVNEAAWKLGLACGFEQRMVEGSDTAGKLNPGEKAPRFTD